MARRGWPDGYNIPDKLQEYIFKKMFTTAEIAKLSQDEYRAYIDSLNSYRDLRNCMDTAKAEGLAEGEYKKAIIIAKNLLKKGMSKEEVNEATGLTKEQVEQLIKEKFS
jgi:predicted transposase/invertase (TIGR01784 family)